jgi:uncharacterized membrane protein YkvA (DUF1232 family)
MMTRAAWNRWATALRNHTYALWLASRDPRVPLPAKTIIVAVVAYALSPIDLIPDFIPVIGYLDDLLLVPLGIWLAVKLVPDPVWQDCKALAAKRTAELPSNRRAAWIVVAIWILVAAGLSLWLAGVANA